MTVGEVRPGYELWRPNREKPQSITTKFVVTLLLVISGALIGLVTITGWSLLNGGTGMKVVCLAFAFIYLLFAFFVFRWNRGVLPVAASLAVLLAIFCAVAADSWFARNKAGFEDALISVDLIGLLVALLIPLQAALIVAAFVGFSQQWHVEEERPIGSGEDYGAGAPPDHQAPQPA